MKRLARGFSILEIVIVVAVVGILLSIGLPNFFNYTQNLQDELVANGSKSTLHTYPGVDHGSVVTGDPGASDTMADTNA